MTKVQTYIGLGSNLCDPADQVTRALSTLARLSQSTLLRHSRLYRSDPVGPPGQPDYINAVALLETALSPETLLDQLQQIEQQHQRVRKQHWGPRTLDLDILLYGNQIIDSERLTVPHAHLHQRSFVLYPLAEISPELSLPDGTGLATLLGRCPMGTLEPLRV